ncbi:hypothetical protein [Kordia jejudonensis]|uniref:hypothetical protein n=1 Tax=Kordia jejudonensis TaxID=1348245 RepID=UPI0006291EF6|nr:hypothetical protein [Kordia jejudonensis]
MSYQLEFCKKCVNKSFSSSQGIVCGLTNEKPTFTNTCPDFVKDDKEEKRIKEREAAMVAGDYVDESGNSVSPWRTALSIIIFILVMIRIAVRCSRY